MNKTIRNILLAFAVWTAYNFLNAGILSLQQKLPYSIAWMSAATQNYIMALLSIPLWFFTKRFPFNKSRALVFFPVHLGLSILFTSTWLALSYLVYWQMQGEFLVRILLKEGVHLWQSLDGLTRYGLLTGIYYTIHYYEKFKEKELKETELSLLTKDMELQNLKSQINPHFLFNTLNSVNALMVEHPEKAREMNAKLAQLLRFALDGYDRRFVTLSQELEFIRTYLDIEKVRFGQKLQVVEQVDKALLDVKVPSMLLQPIVENAIKHGIATQTEGGKLSIDISRDKNVIWFRISNSGEKGMKDLDDLFSKGIGLKNTRERLERLYGSHAEINLRNLEHGGVSVSVRIPSPSV